MLVSSDVSFLDLRELTNTSEPIQKLDGLDTSLRECTSGSAYAFTTLSKARRTWFDKDPQLRRHAANEVLPTAGCEGSHEPTRKREDRLL